ncbi:CRISPR-associated protein Cmr1 [Marinactinospora thermotolerans DSM 45154]|uniref:CRISPR-associated protein Cmr1 n=1 Tax=Marinactinospora thermotolerans DSM 45154 TaxID=1122192 RepID=A0A1T4S4E2_9ACTN|nr:type III-B CRISPR module RAMP protein Cmr1 [Marinactinospora thermotolerans]SKA23159.1 CRISPR-associated protein Cmr1 [Marinactinospora thermotolerans DSM 45154]
MWTTLTLQVATPVFNSAVTPKDTHLDAPPEIRVSSLRGGMRFWLRAMAARYVGDDLYRLRQVEDRVLGSTSGASPIRLRIPSQPEPSEEQLQSLLEGGDQSWPIAYLLGPGLATKGKPLTTRFIPPDEEFTLKVRLDGKDRDAQMCALAALWLNCTYGGVGARVRRGFGNLRIVGAHPGLPFDSGSSLMLTPGLTHYTRAEHLLFTGPVEEAREALRRVCAATGGGKPGANIEEFDWGEEPIAPFPVLGEEHTIAGIADGRHLSWQAVLARAGRELRYFRAGIDWPGVRYRPPVKTEGWIRVIHGKTGEKRMPMAAMGLPLVYKDGYEVRATRARTGGVEQMRRASPLWFRAVGGKNEWRLFSFAFWSRFLPEDDSVSVDLWHQNKRLRKLEVSTDNAHGLVEDWIETLEKGDSFTKKHKRSDNLA